MSQTESQDQAPVFQLKGSMLAITVLELAQNNLEALDRQLAAKVAQAPNFFSNTPLVLALDKLPAGAGAVDLPGLMRVCRQHGLRTLAIRASRIEDIALFGAQRNTGFGHRVAGQVLDFGFLQEQMHHVCRYSVVADEARGCVRLRSSRKTM